MNPKTIVCPINFSPADGVSLAQALSLARWYDSTLHVVHVRPVSRLQRVDDDALRGRLGECIARALQASTPSGVAIVPTLLVGDPVPAIDAYARRVDAGLIVAGQLGSAAAYWSSAAFPTALGRVASCPTIVMPHDGHQTDPATLSRNVLCAIDCSGASLRALDCALDVVQMSAGHLTVLHALEGFPYESTYSSGRALRLRLEYRERVARVNRQLYALVPPDALHWCQVDTETVSGDAHAAILATAAERLVDLVVMGLPRRQRLEQLLAGSTVKRVLRRATSPVLLVPGPSTCGVPGSMDEHRDDIAPHSLACWLRDPPPRTAGSIQDLGADDGHGSLVPVVR